MRRIALSPTSPSGAASPPPAGEPRPVLLRRSIYYSVLAYTGVVAELLWLALMVQALCVGGVVVGLLRPGGVARRAGGGGSGGR